MLKSEVKVIGVNYPGKLLDELCQVVCDCGYLKDCGYMRTTASRLSELHNTGRGHSSEVVTKPAVPLTGIVIKSRLNLSRKQPD